MTAATPELAADAFDPTSATETEALVRMFSHSGGVVRTGRSASWAACGDEPCWGSHRPRQSLIYGGHQTSSRESRYGTRVMPPSTRRSIPLM